MCGEGSVHQTEVHGLVAAEFLQHHLSISAGAERKALKLGYLWRRDPGDRGRSRWANLSSPWNSGTVGKLTFASDEITSCCFPTTRPFCPRSLRTSTCFWNAPLSEPRPSQHAPWHRLWVQDGGWCHACVHKPEYDGKVSCVCTQTTLCIVKNAGFASELTPSGGVFMLSTGAPSWTCHIRTFRTTSPTWTSWWPSLSMAQCKI